MKTIDAIKKRRRGLFIGSLVVVVFVAVLWVVIRPRDPMFHGKPESHWIENLSYNDDDQVKQWREFRPDGVRVLVRGMEGANRPTDRFYRKSYRLLGGFLPDRVLRLLPSPRMDATRGTRARVASLLSDLSKEDTRFAAPVMARALNDESDSVRMIAISFFTDTEGEDAFLNQLPNGEKRKLLPDFVRALEDASNWGVRNNAALALRYYPEERELVVPVLAKALSDPVPKVRMVAAEALHRVAPDTVITEGVVPIVIGVLRDPDDQVAYRAARLLGAMGKDPSLSVPALIEGVLGTNRLVASSAARALGSFPEQAHLIVPVLLQAYQDTNGMASRRASATALKKIDPEAAAKAGVE